MEWRFNIRSFAVFCIIFCIEVLIAIFINDSFIRPYGGDILVVILIYYFAKTFIKTKPIYIATGVVLFAYLIEIGQYFHLAEVLNIQNKILRIAIGSSFSWGDILCYTIGGVICYLIDNKQSE